jgi:hypothetical protein
MASSAVLGIAVAASSPAGAIQPAPDLGNAADANLVQVQGRGHDGDRRGGSNFNRSGGENRGMARGNFSAPRGEFRGNFQARGDRGDLRARGQVQTRELQSRDFKRGDRDDFRARGQVQTREIQRENRRDLDRRDLSRRDISRDGDRKADYSRWKDNRHVSLKHRGWDRHHKHRFFGAFLIGVPFGYSVVAANPCYDWIYGPQGWGYYWNYDRCPVVLL